MPTLGTRCFWFPLAVGACRTTHPHETRLHAAQGHGQSEPERQTGEGESRTNFVKLGETSGRVHEGYDMEELCDPVSCSVVHGGWMGTSLNLPEKKNNCVWLGFFPE